MKDDNNIMDINNIMEDNKNIMEDDSNIMEDNNIIRLHHIATTIPHQVQSIVWCPRINRFTQKLSPNHIPLKVEVETLHNINMDFNRNSITATKEQINKENKRLAMDNTNCPDTGVLITRGFDNYSSVPGCT